MEKNLVLMVAQEGEPSMYDVKEGLEMIGNYLDKMYTDQAPKRYKYKIEIQPSCEGVEFSLFAEMIEKS